jgi:hypothetical protein
MSGAVKQVLEALDQLSEADRHEAIVEILRRSGDVEYPPLDEDTINRIADDSFLEYDRREASDAKG